MEIPFLQRRAKEVNKVVLLPVSDITSNRSQPRRYFDEAALEELCQSIASSGLLQPVTVRLLEGGDYELIAGERRLMAYRRLGRAQIPAIVEAYTDEQSAVLALVENLQRRDLNYFEEAVAIDRLMRELNLTQLQVSQKIGKAQSTVANKLRLLRYPSEIRGKMLEHNLTERHARALLKLPDPCDPSHVEHVIRHSLNVEQTERYVEETLRRLAQKEPPTRLFIIKDMRIFLNSINKAVKMMHSAGIQVDSSKRETEEYIEMTIRVPKAAVYQKKEAASL